MGYSEKIVKKIGFHSLFQLSQLIFLKSENSRIGTPWRLCEGIQNSLFR